MALPQHKFTAAEVAASPFRTFPGWPEPCQVRSLAGCVAAHAGSLGILVLTRSRQQVISCHHGPCSEAQHYCAMQATNLDCNLPAQCRVTLHHPGSRSLLVNKAPLLSAAAASSDLPCVCHWPGV